MDLVAILVPLGICVALPVLVVWLVTRANINRQNKNSEIIIQALKSDNANTAEQLISSLKKSPKTNIDKLMQKFGWGLVLTLIGIGLIVLSVIMAYDNNASESMDEDVFGMIFLTICCLGTGIGLLVTFFVNKKMLKNNGTLNSTDNA